MINFYSICNNANGLKMPHLEKDIDQLIKKGVQGGYDYGSVLHLIKQDPFWSYLYARYIIRGRWVEGEEIIKTCPRWAVGYAESVKQCRWPEAEPYIMKDPWYAYFYATDILMCRWLEAEEYIMRDKWWWNRYCQVFEL